MKIVVYTQTKHTISSIALNYTKVTTFFFAQTVIYTQTYTLL